jgi:soluble lytic murein transglycosylase-like protein
VHYRPGVAEGPSPAAADRTAPETTTGALDNLIERHARAHRIDQALVRAVIAVESGFDQAARSRAGAVGLMQLMPATARALGVNPLVAEENVAGGVRYLADLLESFGTVELALVAYNGGPGLARRYARGEAVLYGETRDYVRLVMDRLRHSRP